MSLTVSVYTKIRQRYTVAYVQYHPFSFDYTDYFWGQCICITIQYSSLFFLYSMIKINYDNAPRLRLGQFRYYQHRCCVIMFILKIQVEESRLSHVFCLRSGLPSITDILGRFLSRYHSLSIATADQEHCFLRERCISGIKPFRVGQFSCARMLC